MEGRRHRAAAVCLVSLGMIVAFAVATAPGARASTGPTWQLAVSATCSGGDVCGGFTILASTCTFLGASSGQQGSCQLMLQGDLGVFTEAIAGTAWDVEPGLLTPVTGVGEFFITAGSVTYTGLPIVAFVASGGPQALGCTVTGRTINCPIPALEAAGLYSPDELDPMILGHYASNVCFGTGIVDLACNFNQQLTLVS